MYDLTFESNGKFTQSFGTMDEAVSRALDLKALGIKTYPIVTRETPKAWM